MPRLKPTRALIAALACASGASADPELQLDWQAPATCPDAGFVQAEVARIAGRPWAQLGGDWREARAAVVPDAGGYRLSLSLLSRTGARSDRDVLAASCTEAAEAAVAILTASLAPGTNADADGAAADGAAADERGAAAPDAAAATTQDDGASDAASGAGSGLALQPELGARLGVDLGTLAQPAPFAELMGGLGLGPLSASVFVGATGSVTGEVSGGAASAEMWLGLAGLDLCWRLGSSQLVPFACAGAELGSLRANGIGTEGRRSGAVFWSASRARAGLDWNITGGSTLSLGATLVVPWRELTVVAPPETVHHTPDVTLRPWLGLGVRFP